MNKERTRNINQVASNRYVRAQAHREKPPNVKSIMLNGMSTRSFLAVLLMAALIMEANRKTAQAKQELSDSGYSYLSQARQFFDSGMEANEQAQTLSSMMPNEDPRATRMLRDSINKATGSFNPLVLSPLGFVYLDRKALYYKTKERFYFCFYLFPFSFRCFLLTCCLIACLID